MLSCMELYRRVRPNRNPLTIEFHGIGIGLWVGLCMACVNEPSIISCTNFYVPVQYFIGNNIRFTRLRQGVHTGALEVDSCPVKRNIVGITLYEATVVVWNVNDCKIKFKDNCESIIQCNFEKFYLMLPAKNKEITNGWILNIPRSEEFHFNDSLDSSSEMRFNPCKVRLNWTVQNSHNCKIPVFQFFQFFWCSISFHMGHLTSNYLFISRGEIAWF